MIGKSLTDGKDKKIKGVTSKDQDEKRIEWDGACARSPRRRVLIYLAMRSVRNKNSRHERGPCR